MGGAMIGALACEPFIKYGKLRLMLAMNALMVAAILICMVNEIWVICVGRFIWGIVFGCFSVVCAKYNNEICPIEYKGPFGALTQIFLTFGITIPAFMALAIPAPPEDPDDWWINFYWRIIWLVPIGIAVVHTALILFCFNHETPVYLYEHGEMEKLNKVMLKFYNPGEVKARIAAMEAAITSGKSDS